MTHAFMQKGSYRRAVVIILLGSSSIGNGLEFRKTCATRQEVHAVMCYPGLLQRNLCKVSINATDTSFNVIILS